MPHRLHTMGLATHVADLRAAVWDTENNEAREALLLLQCDPIAQIMSFMPSREERRGLSAVSPQTRLDSEMMAGESSTWQWEPRVRVMKESLDEGHAGPVRVRFITPATARDDLRRQQTPTSLWWASRCGLPVELSIANNDWDMLGHLDDTLRSRVKKLSVIIRSSPPSATDDAAVSNSTAPATVLTSLFAFPNLQSLSIKNGQQETYPPVSEELLRALTSVVSLPIAALQLSGWMSVGDLSAVAGASYLRTLVAWDCGVRSPVGLRACAALTVLDLFGNENLQSLGDLSHAPCLERLNVGYCDLRDLGETGAWCALVELNGKGNRSLQSLSNLARAPQLKELNASECDIRTVDGLGLCAALTVLNVSGNRRLKSLGDLSDAPRLEKVQASACDLQELCKTGRWSSLVQLSVNQNRHLPSLSGLSAAPLLQRIGARECDLRSLQGIGCCSALKSIDLYGNEHLRDLGDLSKAPCLETVNASRCDLRGLGDAGSWRALRDIDVSNNFDLQSVSGLSGAPVLQELDACDCSISSFRVLETCPKLQTVHTAGNDSLDDDVISSTE